MGPAGYHRLIGSIAVVDCVSVGDFRPWINLAIACGGSALGVGGFRAILCDRNDIAVQRPGLRVGMSGENAPLQRA